MKLVSVMIPPYRWLWNITTDNLWKPHKIWMPDKFNNALMHHFI